MINIIPWTGKPIATPGFYSGVSMASYHSGRLCIGPSVSSSGLRTIFGKSEAHFYDRSPLNPERDPAATEESEALILGRAVHHLLLGQVHFNREFIFPPGKCVNAKGELVDFAYTYKSAREWKEEEVARGLTVLTIEQGEAIKSMALRLAREPLIKGGMLSGHSEITMAWKDGETGVWCLSRPDVIPTDSGDFVDLKTIGRDIVSYAACVRAVGEHGYHQQAALCGEGWRALTGEAMESFCFVFVESKRPFCSRVVRLKDSELLLGTRQNRNAMRRFVKAMNTGFWPGPGGLQEAVQYIDMSDAKRFAIESELKAQGDG